MTVQVGAMLPISVHRAYPVGTGRGGATVWCTLLGPEGPGFLPSCGSRLPVSGGVDLRGWWGLGRTGPSLGRMKLTVVVGGVWCRSYVENYTVDASIFRFASSARAAPCGWCCVVALDRNFNLCGQVSKSKRWMPWHLEPKKDVEICDKPRGADNRAVSRGFPNGETPLGAFVTW